MLERNLGNKKREVKSSSRNTSLLSQNDNLMILINLNSVNTFSEKISFYYKFINFNFICPCCNSNSFCFYGTYSRYISYLENDKVFDSSLNIQRVLCKNCGATHALIPDFLIPYKIYSSNTILTMIINSNNSSLISLENRFNIYRQLILKWKKQFNLYLNKLFSLYSVNEHKLLFVLLKNDDNIFYKFYIEFHDLLLMKRYNSIFNYIPT